jgi:uncharacterized protein (DUF1330 family)
MSAYVILDIEVTDPVLYEEYKKKSTGAAAAFGGRFVVRGGKAEVWEGDWKPSRVVVLEFESVARAREWYDSELYRPARTIREASARTRMIVVEGAP